MLFASLLVAVPGHAELGTEAGEQQRRIFDSGPQSTTVIELYTSEGCSSCPPAEAYLNGLKDHPRLWQRFVPMAFHVDYWDYLGWQDPYAKSAHGERQHRYARYHRASTVYTPAFFVNGEPWRNASMNDTPPVKAAGAGTLRLELNAQRLSVAFDPATDIEEPLSYHVAVLGMGLESSIKRGERAGAHARHEFVVLEHRSETTQALHLQMPIPWVNDVNAGAFALVGWVSRPGSPVPLQATGGYVPGEWLQ